MRNQVDNFKWKKYRLMGGRDDIGLSGNLRHGNLLGKYKINPKQRQMCAKFILPLQVNK